jgi:hypothetical protein
MSGLPAWRTMPLAPRSRPYTPVAPARACGGPCLVLSCTRPVLRAGRALLAGNWLGGTAAPLACGGPPYGLSGAPLTNRVCGLYEAKRRAKSAGGKEPPPPAPHSPLARKTEKLPSGTGTGSWRSSSPGPQGDSDTSGCRFLRFALWSNLELSLMSLVFGRMLHVACRMSRCRI